MKHLVRRGIESMPGSIPVWIQGSYRYLRYPRVRSRRRMQRRILARLETPGLIARGPFQGMRYIPQAFCSEVLPKIVGTYESELIPAIETICESGCDRIVDIGAAEGYYAVGMALRNPESRIVAFEINGSARHFLRNLARCNGVSDRISIEGECVVESLHEALANASRPAVICDCEGAEDALLRPDEIESLRRALILVETHDGLETASGALEGICDRLHERFSSTHDLQIITSRVRNRAELALECEALTNEEAAEAMDEGRDRAQWLFLRPRANFCP
jgi:hypothetical protein